MGHRIDLTGQKFGKLTALSYEMDANGRRCVWTCLCDCGNYTTAGTVALTHGTKISCGCVKRDMLVDRNYIHGHSSERLYKVWKGIRGRCNNPRHSSYPKYGGRGISICDEWSDYETFRSWAYANGYDDTAGYHCCTIDRIDVNKGYSPENCRWVDATTQANNNRANRIITYKGESKTVAQWAEHLGISAGVIYARLNNLGWSEEKALTTPVRKCKKR